MPYFGGNYSPNSDSNAIFHLLPLPFLFLDRFLSPDDDDDKDRDCVTYDSRLCPIESFQIVGLDPTFLQLFSSLFTQPRNTMSPVLSTSGSLDTYLGFVNPLISTLNETASPESLLYASSSSSQIDSTIVKRLAHDAAIVVAQQSARQKAATLAFVEAYQYIIAGVVGTLTLRHLVLIAARNNRKWQLVLQKLDELHMEKLGQKGMKPLGHRAPTSAKLDAVLFYPLTSKWWMGIENPLQLFLLIVSIAINAGFILVSLTLYNFARDKLN